jgi:hypothetical protein
MEKVIIDVNHEVLSLQVKEKIMFRQLEDMKKKCGTSFWPKPTVHHALNGKSNSPTYILFKPCGLCNRGYHYNDIGSKFFK